MSRGPGRLERAIADAFARWPSATFTFEDLGPICYPGLNRVEKKHRVAITRAADRVADRMWWSCEPHHPSNSVAGSSAVRVYYNLCDLRSYTLGHVRREYLQSIGRNREGRLAFPQPRRSFSDLVAEAEKIIAEGKNCWWRHVALNKARRDGETDTDEYKRLDAEPAERGGPAASVAFG